VSPSRRYRPDLDQPDGVEWSLDPKSDHICAFERTRFHSNAQFHSAIALPPASKQWVADLAANSSVAMERFCVYAARAASRRSMTASDQPGVVPFSAASISSATVRSSWDWRHERVDEHRGRPETGPVRRA